MYKESEENGQEIDEHTSESGIADSDPAIERDILSFDEESGYFIKGTSAASSIF